MAFETAPTETVNQSKMSAKAMHADHDKSTSTWEPLPKWVIQWLWVSTIVCTWDASFIMTRPHSFPGGSLVWLFYPYKYYITVDQRYMDSENDYVFAQSLLNYVECIVNLIALYMHARKHQGTALTTFTVTVMTWWKTVLYFLMLTDFCTRSKYRQGNSLLTELFLVVIPNGVWLAVPMTLYKVKDD